MLPVPGSMQKGGAHVTRVVEEISASGKVGGPQPDLNESPPSSPEVGGGLSASSSLPVPSETQPVPHPFYECGWQCPDTTVWGGSRLRSGEDWLAAVFAILNVMAFAVP